MANEAVVTIVAQMRDEASAKMKGLTETAKDSQQTMQNLQIGVVAVGSALAAMGSLLGQIDSPAAKMASNFLLITGAISSTAGAIMTAIPVIKQLITWLRSLAVVQTLVKALSGPVGWGQIGIGLGIAAAATAGIYAATGGFSSTKQTTVNINTQAFTGSETDARNFASNMQGYIRENERVGR